MHNLNEYFSQEKNKFLFEICSEANDLCVPNIFSQIYHPFSEIKYY